MFWTNFNVSTRKVSLSVAVLGVTAMGLVTGALLNPMDASTAPSSASSSAGTPAATFPGAGVGSIPDGSAGAPPQFGPSLDVTFNVTGLTGNVTDVTVNFTGTHTWAGDLDVVLSAPGGSPSMVIVSRIGVTSAESFGDSSNYNGTYNFSDAAAGTNIWTMALTSCDESCDIPSGNYRTTAPGQTGQTNPPAVTSLNTTFAGLSAAQANGTWTLRFRDAGADDVGSISAANLTVNATGGGGGPAADAPVDLNGDGRTDYVVVRNIGGGSTGQIRWFFSYSDGSGGGAADWGLASDFFVSEDFDGDNKDDIAVWRPGVATEAAFFILNSATSTARTEFFGQTGDDPQIVDDYNGDGMADVAVYRMGITPGQQSFWFYRTTPNGPITYVPWGSTGDIPAPGDYDGNGSADFVIQRANGQFGVFWRLLSTGAVDVVQFGLAIDVVVPGDYDGDGKTDIAVARGSGGNIFWFWDPSSTPPGDTQGGPFGDSELDFVVQGDYTGDGRTDLAVWREGVFWILNIQTGAVSAVPFGLPEDYPVANFNAH